MEVTLLMYIYAVTGMELIRVEDTRLLLLCPVGTPIITR